jgi:DNA repair ATPase RecN
MKKYIVASFLLMLFLLSGCGDPVQNDLLNYVNEKMPALGKEETKILEKYEDVTGPNYTDDQTLYDALKVEIIPAYNQYIEDLESVKNETEELRKIHEDYIEAANIQASAFLTVITALENQDSGLINEANQKLNTARKMMRDYQNAVEKLAKEHDVKLKKNKDAKSL